MTLELREEREEEQMRSRLLLYQIFLPSRIEKGVLKEMLYRVHRNGWLVGEAVQTQAHLTGS